MPHPRKPARLYYRAKRDLWTIKDGDTEHGTGVRGRDSRDAAEAALRRYLAGRAPERAGPARADEVTVGEVLTLYMREVGPTLAAPATLAYSCKALSPFWSALTCDAVKGATCRRYVRERGVSDGTARRELGVLQAALNHARREGRLLDQVLVTLPKSGQPRDRWLTRDELRAIMRHAQPHLRRFIAISVLTGRRASAVLQLRWCPSLDNGWIDLDAGVIHFLGQRQRETSKRRGSVKMPRQLARLARTWTQGDYVVEVRGKPVKSVKRAWHTACEAAGVEGATIHTLKHTAVTWAFQRGMSREDAEDYFGTTGQTLTRVYRQHSPEHQSRAVSIMERRK